eukprot:TRINITY_DN4096_c0_g1_i1.p1 TRINITY_DN4096_c0_g1~~TRINITY_DN4096_c0_g1_i1.p1  ORF type:complete len:210 (-),score=34.80 TRINITY_DN4096_c0_g1_i1:117-746(-)
MEDVRRRKMSLVDKDNGKVKVTNKYLDIPDYQILVVGSESSSDCVLYHIQVVGTQQSMTIKKRFREVREFHEHFVALLNLGIEPPPRHFLSFNQDANFIEKRKKEMNVYFHKLTKFPTLVLDDRFLQFFQIRELETEEMLRNREIKELKKVLIRNEKANKALSAQKDTSKQRRTTGDIGVTQRTIRTKSETGRMYQGQPGHLNVPGWGM